MGLVTGRSSPVELREKIKQINIALNVLPKRLMGNISQSILFLLSICPTEASDEAEQTVSYQSVDLSGEQTQMGQSGPQTGSLKRQPFFLFS